MTCYVLSGTLNLANFSTSTNNMQMIRYLFSYLRAKNYQNKEKF